MLCLLSNGECCSDHVVLLNLTLFRRNSTLTFWNCSQLSSWTHPCQVARCITNSSTRCTGECCADGVESIPTDIGASRRWIDGVDAPAPASASNDHGITRLEIYKYPGNKQKTRPDHVIETLYCTRFVTTGACWRTEAKRKAVVDEMSHDGCGRR